MLLANINGIDREVYYVPLREKAGTDLSELCISITSNDLLLILAKNNSKHIVPMQDVLGKMAVVDNLSEVNLLHLSKYLAYMGIKELDIVSINLSPKVEQEVFLISDSPKVRYSEVGVLSFIEDVGTVPLNLFFNKNKSNLYILRDGTYRDMKYILAQVGKHGMNLGRGGSQLAHVISPLDLRLSTYLMALFGVIYPEIVTQNMFNSIPKDKYLPYYNVKKPKKNYRKILKP